MQTTPHSRGFTLLEVMVVLAIIGGLLSMASLSFNRNYHLEQAQEFAQKLVIYMSVLQDEASLQNIDLGLFVGEDGLQLFYYKAQKISTPDKLKTQSKAAEASGTKEKAKKPWQPYKSTLTQQLKLPENIQLRLELEGQEADLSEQLVADVLTPALLFLSADEYTPFKLYFEHSQDPSFIVSVSGDGLSPIQMHTELINED